jgi:DASH complex subunit SPC19
VWISFIADAQVFALVNDSTIKKYQADLSEEIEPEINELILLAEQGLKGLQKKESQLQAKVSTLYDSILD